MLRRRHHAAHAHAQAVRVLCPLVRLVDGVQHRKQGEAQLAAAAVAPVGRQSVDRLVVCDPSVAHWHPQAAEALRECDDDSRAYRLLPLARPRRRGRLGLRRRCLLHTDRQGLGACLHVRPFRAPSWPARRAAYSPLAHPDRRRRRPGLGVGAQLHVAFLLGRDALQPCLRRAKHLLSRLDGQAEGREHDSREPLRRSHDHVLLVGAAVRPHH
mmetsp:Transcript_42774/g.106486  ORF Transcript_42774/g.106486 Transcript_42774/m.106486 type:complete len:213 (-) Transcript_42774:699-1337(-)